MRTKDMIDALLRKLAISAVAMITVLLLLVAGLCLVVLGAFWHLSAITGPGAAALLLGGGILLSVLVVGLVVLRGRKPPVIVQRAADAGHGSADPSLRAAGMVDGWVRENPQKAALFALGIGTVLGVSPRAQRLAETALHSVIEEMAAASRVQDRGSL